MDYQPLYKRLAQEIIKQDGKIGTDTRAFIDRLMVDLKAENWQLSADAEAKLNDYLIAMRSMVQVGIATAVSVMTGQSMASAVVLALTEQAFVERWADGKNLSQRLWILGDNTKTGLTQVLQTAAKSGASHQKILYDMQRTIEASSGERFKIVTAQANDWVTGLSQSAKAMIHNPESRAKWEKTMKQVTSHVNRLSVNGTRSGAERVLSQITKAVATGNEALIADAVKWWIYDKQLYQLKRISRTEMATAAHRAVIESVAGDSTIIGFRWILSSSHKVFDICDYYANIDQGLGKGMWRKENVPRNKAHSQCSCILQPRVTPIKEQGDIDYSSFIQNATTEQRAQLLPQWANRLTQLGMSPKKLLRDDGLGLLTREQLKEKMGADKFTAADTLGKALTEKQWPTNKLKLKLPQTKDTLASLQANSHIDEVGQFLTKLERDAYQVDSRDWHYFRYKYHFNDSALTTPAVLDRRFDRVLHDSAAQVYRTKSGRLAVVSTENARMAFVHDNGQRISVYSHTAADVQPLGESLWTIKQLIS